MITDFAVARDALYVKRMRNGIDNILRMPHGGSAMASLDMPMDGTVLAFQSDGAHDGLLFSMQNWTTPRTAYIYDPAIGTSADIRLGSNSPVDVSMLTSTQVEAVSADGTRVPMSIVHRRDIAADGSHRAVVHGYGGYGYSIQPFFDPVTAEWIKAGNVLAIAHVRGGGEKGESWRLGGHGINKRKGVEDLLACVDALIDQGYTARDRVGISGRSAGGLLIGGVVAQAPDRFAAAFIGVGWLNPVRLLEGQGGAAHVKESADPRTADGLRTLAAIDPYLNLREDTTYPPVLLTVGLNDPRVPGWEAGKFAARLQALDAEGGPTWLRAEADSGHAAGTLDAYALEAADMYAFFDAWLGRASSNPVPSD